MREVKIVPTPLKGVIDIPASKSLCHRAIIAAAMAKGTSIINNIVLSEDILATINAVQILGAKVTLYPDKAIITGTSFQGIHNSTIDCKESGSTLRFIIPLGLLTGSEISYIGSGNLCNRPLDPYIEIFKEQGIKFSAQKLPMNIKGELRYGDFMLKGNISSQFITGLMFALPTLQGDSTIYIVDALESKAYIDLTLDALQRFGIHIENNNYKSFFIKGRQSYNAIEYTVEGDYSQTAFWVAAGLLGQQVECNSISNDSKQSDKAFIDIMINCGGQIKINNSSITASKSQLNAFDADVSQYPDIAPILAVVAALSHGTSHITGASRLRIKECDRLMAISTELNKLGAEVYENEDNLVIVGKEYLKGGEVDSWGDHRIAMALSIASQKCTNPITIKNSTVVSKSYPGFFEDFIKLGGIINERSLG